MLVREHVNDCPLPLCDDRSLAVCVAAGVIEMISIGSYVRPFVTIVVAVTTWDAL
jgi:hypothetical protein